MRNSKSLAKLSVIVSIVCFIPGSGFGQTAVPMLINYQGELRSPTSGEPLPDGSYEMLLGIYDVEFGGTPLWEGTHSSLNDNPVEVKNGLFNVILGSGAGNALDASVFTGANRWLEIRVEIETLSPRQRITSAAYSIMSEHSRLLGGKDAADFAEAAHAHSGGDIASGTVGEARIDAAVARDSEVSAKFDTATGHDHDGASSKPVSYAKLTDVPTSFPPSAHGHSGDDISSGTVADARVDAAIARDSEIMPKVLAGDGTGSSLDADLLDGIDSAGFAAVVHAHDAGAIASGNLDNSRFSAYADLSAEGYLDNSAGDDLVTVTQADGRYWGLLGNSGTTPGTHFLGTTDNQALQFYVNNTRALRVEPVSISPNIIAGYSGNGATPSVPGASISGGGRSQHENRVTDAFGSVGGGFGNLAGNDTGGVVADADCATVGGGADNTASGHWATVGGGSSNTASEDNASVAGGRSNTASGHQATVGGGSSNTASGRAATVPGGDGCTASGDYAFAAGRRAKANHAGSFVWADSTDADSATTADDQFLVRASGGATFDLDGETLRAEGVGSFRDGIVTDKGTSGRGFRVIHESLRTSTDPLVSISCGKLVLDYPGGQLKFTEANQFVHYCGHKNEGSGSSFTSGYVPSGGEVTLATLKANGQYAVLDIAGRSANSGWVRLYVFFDNGSYLINCMYRYE